MKKKLLILLVALGVIFLTLFILLGRYTDRVIDPYVRSLLESTKPMGHKIEYKRIRVNLFQKDIILKEVRMYPDSMLTNNDLRFEIKVDKIRLTGFSIREMLFEKTLTIDDFLVANPEVIVLLPMDHKEVIEDVKKDETPKKGNQLLKKISLKKITLSHGSFRMIRDTVVLAISPDINILAEEIILQKNSKDEPIGFTYGDYLITLTDIDLYSKEGLYDISLGKFSAGKKNLTIALEDLMILPKYDKKAFSGKLKYQTDRFDVKLGSLHIHHTGLWKLLENKPLEIVRLEIDSVNADIYRDKNVAFNFNKFPSFYNESFLKIGYPVIIDSVMITNSRLIYGELNEGGDKAWTVSLEDFKLQTYNLTTLVEEDTSHNVMHLYIQAKVMGEGNMNVEVILPLEGERMHDFVCLGSIGKMNLAPLNDLLETAINIKFNAGQVDRITFNFTATDQVSNGWMEFHYSGLDAVILKKNHDPQWGFISGLANTLILSNNPHDGKAPKIVSVGYERDKNKGIINYIWKTLQSGLVRTIVPTKKYQINKAEAAAKNKLYRKQDRTDKKLQKQDEKTRKAKEQELEK
jgi:hypothetical protein